MNFAKKLGLEVLVAVATLLVSLLLASFHSSKELPACDSEEAITQVRRLLDAGTDRTRVVVRGFAQTAGAGHDSGLCSFEQEDALGVRRREFLIQRSGERLQITIFDRR